jgi:hypothetical protein
MSVVGTRRRRGHERTVGPRATGRAQGGQGECGEPERGHQRVVVHGEMARRQRCLTSVRNRVQQRAEKGK